MFIDFIGARAALRQEGHVCDPTECMSPGGIHDPPDGGRRRSASSTLITPSGARPTNFSLSIELILRYERCAVAPRLRAKTMRKGRIIQSQKLQASPRDKPTLQIAGCFGLDQCLLNSPSSPPNLNHLIRPVLEIRISRCHSPARLFRRRFIQP